MIRKDILGFLYWISYMKHPPRVHFRNFVFALNWYHLTFSRKYYISDILQLFSSTIKKFVSIEVRSENIFQEHFNNILLDWVIKGPIAIFVHLKLQKSTLGWSKLVFKKYSDYRDTRRLKALEEIWKQNIEIVWIRNQKL